ncbi:hypothetical protein G3N55_08910 [Dissulfurirhabdus thermomarina]|uniref:Uncharacterized protein n=1 Tax=Dissulfurirhabdus thermomarina TaxID=1765737 RepID=A0A6N9TR92_DISTH|nr:hypothetical protein [Dissulfurirhabdus thermomarina]NDY42960.1 hypothetical protein [Dissulfurirhabdus thermomarina]NMX24326.1 hypothetical protein [Dissulfurirhabdus thermomarina]
MKTDPRPARRTQAAVVLALAAALWMGLPPAAGAGVTARYAKIHRGACRLVLELTDPAPATVILVQRFPPGTRLLEADPAPAGVDEARGRAKWLFKAGRTGKIRVRFRLEPPGATARLRGEIRYRDPATGRMETREVAP